jgi:hypothetical protein
MVTKGGGGGGRGGGALWAPYCQTKPNPHNANIFKEFIASGKERINAGQLGFHVLRLD